MSNLTPRPDPLKRDDEEIEERAAILEFDAKLSRREAERRASSAENSQPKSTAWHPDDFLAENLIRNPSPPREILIEGLLNARDLVGFIGRRRHGKTQLDLGISVALALGLPEFLGYRIMRQCNVVAFFLEDDKQEIEARTMQLLTGCRHDSTQLGGRLSLITRSDIVVRAKVPISIHEESFTNFVKAICKKRKPDLVILDNLAHLVLGDYSNPKTIQKVITLGWALAQDYNAAVLLPAHPKKRSNYPRNDGPTLRDNPEDFFEECMGSSHFINSCGSLWGLERDLATDETDFLGGSQRTSGQQSIATLIKNDGGWFEINSKPERNLKLACNTEKRTVAWKSLPATFSFTEGFEAVKAAMSSKSSFSYWLNTSLIRLGLVSLKNDGEHYEKKL